MPAPLSDGQRPRLHVVTGKGGTGKTTVATALALALADQGARVLLCEVEGRQGVARLLGLDPLPPRETEVAEGVGGGTVVALAVEPRSALMLYLDTFYHLGRAGSALEKVGAVDFITSVAPGLRDILLVGMVYEAVRRSAGEEAGAGGPAAADDRGERPAYDAVVLDAPPTGRIGKFLGIGAELSTLAGGGPIAGQASSVAELLRSPATAVHLVTLLEELPVTETLEAVDELAGAGLNVGAVVANRVVRAPELHGAEPAALTSALEAAGLDPAPDVGALLAQARVRAAEADEQGAQRVALESARRPVVELPLLLGGIDTPALYALADVVAAREPLVGPSRAAAPTGRAGAAS